MVWFQSLWPKVRLLNFIIVMKIIGDCAVNLDRVPILGD